jgi:hypothetical protein
MLTALILSAATTVAVPCTTPKPGPIQGQPWVCVKGAWLPPGHPDIPALDVPPTHPTPTEVVRFRIGKRYVRGTTDLFIMGFGQDVLGEPVIFAQCLWEGDGCYYQGQIRLLPINTNAGDWTDVGPLVER